MTQPFLNLDTKSRYEYLQQKCADLIEECDQIVEYEEDDLDNRNMVCDRLYNYRMMFAYLTQELKAGQNDLFKKTILINCVVLTEATEKIRCIKDPSTKLPIDKAMELTEKIDALIENHQLFLKLAEVYRTSIESADQRVIEHMQNRLMKIFAEQYKNAASFISEAEGYLDKFELSKSGPSDTSVNTKANR